MKNTLFIGNGLFRLKTEQEKQIGGCGRDKSWGDLLSDIAFGARDVFNSDNPMPIEFDRLLNVIGQNRQALKGYYSVEGRDDFWKQILSIKDTSLGLKRYLAGWFNERGYCAPDILGMALRPNFDYVLTSNYDLRIENYLIGQGGDAGVCSNHVWHVHGSIDDPENIVLGQGDYIESAHSLTETVTSYVGDKGHIGPADWPLLFLISNIHILGFGFGSEELDLWHLLHLRSIWLSDHLEVERNRIKYYHFYPSGGQSLRVSDPVRYGLFRDYGVEVVHVPVVNGDYEDAYRTAIDLISEDMNGRSINVMMGR